MQDLQAMLSPTPLELQLVSSDCSNFSFPGAKTTLACYRNNPVIKLKSGKAKDARCKPIKEITFPSEINPGKLHDSTKVGFSSIYDTVREQKVINWPYIA